MHRGVVQATVSAAYLYGAPVRSGDVDVAVHSRPRRVRVPRARGVPVPATSAATSRTTTSPSTRRPWSPRIRSRSTRTATPRSRSRCRPTTSTPTPISSIRASVASPSNEVISKTFTVPYFRSQTLLRHQVAGLLRRRQEAAEVRRSSRVTPDGKAATGAAKVTVTRRDWNCVWEDWGYRGSYQCKDNHQTILEQDAPARRRQARRGRRSPPRSGGDYWVVVEGAPGQGGRRGGGPGLRVGRWRRLVAQQRLADVRHHRGQEGVQGRRHRDADPQDRPRPRRPAWSRSSAMA